MHILRIHICTMSKLSPEVLNKYLDGLTINALGSVNLRPDLLQTYMYLDVQYLDCGRGESKKRRRRTAGQIDIVARVPVVSNYWA